MMCIACQQNPPYGLRSYLCGPCFGTIRRDLATIAWAHAWLGAELVALPASFRPGSLHAAAASRPPLSLGQHDMRVQIEAVLTSWARLTGEEMLPAQPRPRSGEVRIVAAWLGERDRLSWISDQPWADEFARELRELRQQAYAVAPWDRAREDRPLPCPSCGMLTLTVYGGDEGVTCRNRVCGRYLTLVEYHVEVAAWWQRATERREVLAA